MAASTSAPTRTAPNARAKRSRNGTSTTGSAPAEKYPPHSEFLAHAARICGVRYRFGAFTLDPDTRQLVSNGDEIHLSPKAFDLLNFLVANRARAVSKAELQERLWPSTFVEETNLATLAAEIRRGLRDSATHPTFLRTIYAFGYRF